MVFNQQAFAIALQEVGEQLSPEVKSPKIGTFQGMPLHIFETLPSTNQTLWELVDRGAPEGTAVMAAQQTAGRGQWGRQWQSTLGGLYLSLALAPNLQVSHSAQLTLCSAWGIAIALRSYGIPVLLKWPNDLLLQERKLGGILTETRVHQGQINKAVVGVGINWSNDVPESGITLQSFCKEQLNPVINSLERLAAIVIQGLLSGYQCWLEKGINILLPSYLELLDSKGHPVTVDGNPGIVTGVTPSGELRVRTNFLTEAAVAPISAPASATEIYLKPGTISLGYRR
ncbi:MAG: biotin--[acetyl-CoA-carboxylase] ligase [Coleofasciculus sp. S288]|nr:biotin--[acetyl-CoA-carboxylase] ligase [Coleofasciculus sp. S288]